MKNQYIKHIKNGLVMGLCALTLSSCLLDDEKTDFGRGPDFVGFTRSTITVPFENDGSDYTYNAVISLAGPHRDSFNGEVTVTVGVDQENSDAEEGVHYSLPSESTVVLNSSNDFTASFPITIITEGIEAPLEKKLNLYVSSIDTDSENIVISDTGKSSLVNVSYICFADLTGSYSVTNSVCGTGSSGTIPLIDIAKNEDGGWDLATADGGLLQYCTSNTGLVNGGSIIVVCGEVLPSDDITFCGSNGIGCITGGSWDEETGVLTLELNDTFFGVGDYTATYTRVD